MGLLERFDEMMEEMARSAVAVNKGWIAFVHEALGAVEGGPPVDAEQLEAVLQDPWFIGDAAEPEAAAPFIAWVGAHAVTEDRIAGDRRWPAWFAKLKEARVRTRVKGFSRAFAVLMAPFTGAARAAEILVEHELGTLADFLDGADQAGLLSPQDRRLLRRHRVLGETYEDEARFLAALEADLAPFGLGPEAVQALWSEGRMSAETADAIAAAHGAGDRRTQALLAAAAESQRFQAWEKLRGTVANLVFAGSDPDAWQRRWERMALLAAPLLAPGELADAMAVQEKHVERRVADWEAGRVAGFRQALADLSAGAGHYVDAHAALAAAGADLATLEETLGRERVALDRSSFSHAFCWALVAGLGHRAHADDGRWWADAAVSLAGALPHSGARELEPLGRPFGAGLTADPAVFAAAAAHPVDRTFSSLWSTFGLAEPCLRDPGLYKHVARRASIAELRVPAAVAQRHPEAWLRHAKRAFDERGWFTDVGVTTPAALAWYREILDVAQQHARSALMHAIAGSLDQRALLAFFREHYPAESGQGPDHRLFDRLDDYELLVEVLDDPNPAMARLAASRLESLSTSHRADGIDPARRARFVEVSRQHADLFASLYLSARAGEPQRWKAMWEAVREPANRVRIADALFDCLRRKDKAEEARPVLLELFARTPEPFAEAVEAYHDDYAQGLATALAAIGGELLDFVPRLCVKHLGQSTWLGGERTPLDARALERALAARPESFAALEDKHKVKLLPYLSDEGFVAVGPAVVALLEGSKAKTVTTVGAAVLAERSPEALETAGVLASKSRNLRNTLHRGLALAASDAVLPLLRERAQDKANDDYVRGLILDRLEAAGDDVAAVGPQVTLDALRAEAEKVKVPKAVSQVWNAELATIFDELGESVGLLALARMHAGGGERLPRAAREIVELLSPARREDLAFEATGIWVAQNGSDKVAWMMRLLARYGDERCADALTRAVKSWNKSRKAKANQATRWMATIPGSYAPTQIKTIYESTKYSESIVRTAREALEAVAEAGGMELEDLLDQLVPDFGMSSDGLALDVGPYQYLVKVMPDLSLRVVNPKTGKATKSLPKAKADEDADLRGLAENRFKALRKGLRPLSTAQTKKLAAAVLSGKTWRADVWRRLYLEHPVLRLLGQAIVWTALDAAGAPTLRCRPGEDGTAIDLSDEPVDLAPASTLRITHPAELDETERDAWRGHFADYEIASPIGQWDLNVTLPADDEVEDETRFVVKQGHVVPRTSFTSLLERYGYARGGSGDGGRIHDHSWSAGGLRVDLAHTAMSAWFDQSEQIAIDYFEVWGPSRESKSGGWRRLKRDEIPTALLAGIVQQANELAAKGSGFDPKWRSL